MVNDTTGIHVPPGDVSALRDALERIVADAPLRARLGAAGRERAKGYSIDTATTAWEQVFNDVLETRTQDSGMRGLVKSASVTVNWGPPSDTVVALQSLASMTRPPDLIICIDNGSPAADVSQLRAGMPKNTVFIALDDNIGLAAAHNVGMDYALSQDVDWTLLLNNDAIATAQCLDRCIAEATADPRIAIVGPAATFTDEPHLLWFAGGRERAVRVPRPRLAYASPRLPRRRAQTSVIYPAAAHCCRRRHSDRLARSGLTTSCTTRKPSGASGPQLGGGDPLSWRGSVYARRQRQWRARGSLGLTENTAYYLARNPLRFALETPRKLLRLTRVTGILVVYGAFNAWRAIKSGQRAVASAYLQGLADALRTNG